MIGAEPLKPRPATAQDGPPRIAFPALDQREGADPTWAETMDALASPAPKRSEALGMAPTVADSPGRLRGPRLVDDEVVQLHLEQRVVQRLLGRFTAQGFVHHDLSRACLAHTADAVPRVMLLGRLCLYGPGAARLHEEMIPVTARWGDPKIRKGPSRLMPAKPKPRRCNLLEDALGKGSSSRCPRPLQNMQASAPSDVQDLLPYLQTRGEEYAPDASKLLPDRAEAEAKAMREILETQKKHIAKTVKDHKQTEMPLFA